MPIAGINGPLVSTLVPLARRNEMFLHALLCCTAATMAVSENITGPMHWATYHRGRAFELLRSALSDPKEAISDEVLASILVLSGHDVSAAPPPFKSFHSLISKIILGLHEAHEVHIQGINRIIAARGGVNELGFDGILKMLVSWYVLI
jgi:hypothetical protein